MGMDRYRTIVRLEDIRESFEKGRYEEARNMACTIEKERIRDTSELMLLADVFRKTEDYKNAKKYLLLMYEKKPTYRVLEDLMEICLQEKNPVEADKYLKEFCRLSGGDPRNYIYEYRIGRQLKKSNEQLLPVLQTLKAEEYTEKYAYELAKLYYRMGKKQECINECGDLILWFGEGVYVDRAKALLAYFRGEISASQLSAEAEKNAAKAKEYTPVQPPSYEEAKADETPSDEEANMDETPSNEEAEADETYESSADEETEPDYEPSEMTDRQDSSGEAMEKESFALAEDDGGEDQPKETEQDNYEQISLFSPIGTGTEEKVEEKPLSEPSRELSKRFADAGISISGVFHEFAEVESVRKQIIRLLEVTITVRKRCQCLMITGERESGKTTLSSYLAKALFSLNMLKSPRIAKISAEKLNGMNLFEKQDKLKDCCLIIEKAGSLTTESTMRLLQFLTETKVLDAVIIEDDSVAMNALLRSFPDMNRVFNNRIHLPKYSQTELTMIADAYLNEQDYIMEEDTRRYFEQRLTSILRSGQEGRLKQMMVLLKGAVKTADERNKELLMSMASSGKLPAAGKIRLLTEDFPE